ncbi:hypothetical protein CPHO_03320 [Corynebacterium phocae]|uniref:Cutinase n=1 Tax=Corynebacterium phocae TaxID=161895 RepID=A0A1L7D289_9CORY|nr:hypothetical protein [Corynebacterium phocae]APT92081.1 hypothetical protein CPHO_03320 [Corynebacterium phocae]KAA8726466.1 hypothetical protein F4V58_02870 [Corynebacterium phocae]
MRTSFLSRLAGIGVAVAATVTTLAVPAAQAQTCPAVVVVAARGSGQNGHIYPTRYSGQEPFASNGWEGETIRAMLHTVESRYRATHGGQSVMRDVYVLGLSPQDYPATYPEYTVPNVAVPQSLPEVISIAQQWTIPVINTGIRVAQEFFASVGTGRSGVMRAIDGYERASGCRPQYILTGFSQGAMILAEHERDLAARGQLAGVVYMGSPNTAAGDPFTVGNTTGWGGILGWWPFNNTVASRATVNRVNYCLPLDGVCDISRENLEAARAAGGGNHGRYFLWGSQWDAHVADQVGRWVDQVRFR